MPSQLVAGVEVAGAVHESLLRTGLSLHPLTPRRVLVYTGTLSEVCQPTFPFIT